MLSLGIGVQALQGPSSLHYVPGERSLTTRFLVVCSACQVHGFVNRRLLGEWVCRVELFLVQSAF